ADAAVVLNVSEDHLDRHGSLQAYAAIKSRIYDGDGVQVINRDDALCADMVKPGRSVIGFCATVPQPGDFGLSAEGDEAWLMQGTKRLLPRSELGIAGRHNALNALAALALGSAVGAEMTQMIDALRSFRGLQHRVEPVARRSD